jgi:multidrug efflux pump
MLGVTLFGIFLTPVFFAVIQGFSEGRAFAAEATRWTGSALLGGLAGLTVGFLLDRLDILGLPWALGTCGPAGVLAALAARDIHRRIRPQSRDSGQAPAARPEAGVFPGDPLP